MKDITAILFRYSDSLKIYRALNSLRNNISRVKSIIILQEKGMSPIVWSHNLKSMSRDSNDYGDMLNDMMDEINTSYVLFLHDTHYLSPMVRPDTLKLSSSETVLGTLLHNRNIRIHQPLLVRTTLLKKEKFLALDQLPFKEALLTAWLANVKKSQQLMEEDLLKQSSINRSANTIQKESIMQKYQLKETKMAHITIAVVISTYNMERYLETAIYSCLLQNETFNEILIIDDGSTDNSRQRLERLANQKQVKVWYKKNEGKAKALNELLSHVTSDFILELDADDWLDPDACAVIKRHLSDLPEKVSVLYGNLRKWKQTGKDVRFKKIAKGATVKKTAELLSYRFPLGPRIYRTSTLQKEGGFPVLAFEDGRMYEDVSILNQLLKKYPFCYKDFTIYNVREHDASITKSNHSNWQEYLKILKSQ